jgi:hypothetical protein
MGFLGGFEAHILNWDEARKRCEISVDGQDRLIVLLQEWDELV